MERLHASMRPAREGRENLGAADAAGAGVLASMRPAREGRENGAGAALEGGAGDASMRPAREGRENRHLEFRSHESRRPLQ